MTSTTLANPWTGAPITVFTHYPNVDTNDLVGDRFLNIENGVATLLSLGDIKRAWGHPDAADMVGNLHALAGQKVVKVVALGAGSREFDADDYTSTHVVLAYLPTSPFETDPHYFLGEFVHTIDGRG